jgi:hypothetical protein
MPSDHQPFLDALTLAQRLDTTDFAHAWVGMEPTFQSAKSIRKWSKYAAKPGGEDAYFLDKYMLRTQRKVARSIKKRYEKALKNGGGSACLFAAVELDDDLDQWKVRRQNLHFHWPGDQAEPFEVRFSLDPETFEYSIKPVPLAWFYDERFVAFLQEFLWWGPHKQGLRASVAHGGGQFSLSAKTFLGGSLLADDIATKLNHPELATWIMDWPNPDDRSFRATRQRFHAFRTVLEQYWAGAFHPRAIGQLTVENAYLDRGFSPCPAPPPGLMDPAKGALGEPREVFQNNFAFGRAVRLLAQNVHPGYWQSCHPDEDGYRPDQIMRYSEGNLNRLQIVGEWHVKSGKVLDPERIPEFDAPLDIALLYDEASWEDRGQMGRTSAHDFVEALLLNVHHAQYLQKHPGVRVKDSLLQDQLLGDAEDTLRTHGRSEELKELHQQARERNLEMSRGRLRTDWMEPETLFWAAWHALPAGAKAAVAREAVGNFIERVEQAAESDPRPDSQQDPMEWHRHRVHPLLWEALAPEAGALHTSDPVRREFEAWQAKREEYLARRPVFSQVGLKPPWEQRE